MECLLATRSQGKSREIKALLKGTPHLKLLSLEEAGIPYSAAEDDVEEFATFRENARAKALFFARKTGLPTIADDSGIAVAALNGAPGVRSKRFASDAGYGISIEASINTAATAKGLTNAANGIEIMAATKADSNADFDQDRLNNELLLQLLQGIPAEGRTAHYACVAALAAPDYIALTTIGTCSGLITEAPRGQGGFGYDPIFLIPELEATFAEIPAEEKNRRSHRARAFLALRAHLHTALPR